MKSRRLVTAAAVTLPAALGTMIACGGDTKAKPDAHITVPDSGGSGGSGSATCSVAASLGALTSFAAQGAQYTAGSASDATNTLAWQGQLQGMQAVEVLIFGNCGSGSGAQCGGYPTPDWPTTFGPKSNIDLSMAPDAIVAVLANYNASTMKFQDIYLSTAGTLNVTAAGTKGQTFSGNASNVTVQHYDFGASSVMPDPDMCMSNISSLTFSGSAMFQGGKVVLDGSLGRDEAVRQYLMHRYQ